MDLESAPDNGDLVYVDFGDASNGTGSIGRVSYTPGKSPPFAANSATPREGPKPLSVSFNGSASSDPEGKPLRYDWDFGDGITALNAGPTPPPHPYAAYGRYAAWLTVTDPDGLSATDNVTINVDGPAVTMAQPTSPPPPYTDDQPVSLQGSASGTHGPVSLSWNVILHHNTHIHDIGTFGGSNTSFTPLANHDADSYYDIILTATDDDYGVQSTVTRTIYPSTVKYTLASDPPGAPVSYGGTNQTAPFTATSAVGYETSISAADQFSSGGATYTFDHWSDGGARLHGVTIPSSDSTLTAVYRQMAAAPGTPPAAGTTVTAAAPKDRTGPSLSLALRRSELRRGRVNGMASDPSNVKVVEVALRSRSKSKGRCRWWSSRSRGLRPAASCARPRWMSAQLSPVRADRRTRPWTVNLKRGLPSGRYVLLVRAVDGAGNTTSKVGKATETSIKM